MVAQNTLRTCEGNPDFSEIDFKFAISRDLNKCLELIKIQRLLLRCAPIFELSSDISTMSQSFAFITGARVEGNSRNISNYAKMNIKIKINTCLLFTRKKKSGPRYLYQKAAH